MKRLLLLSALFVSACNTAPNSPDGDPFDARDPIKPVNEAIFSFNLSADSYVLKPVAHLYHELPGWSRYGISNFLSNLSEPGNMVNGVLQRDPQIAFTSMWRFLLNSTYGFAGLRDFAGENGLQNKDTDFGKTLGSFGLGEGAYVVLPVAGPSSVRDTSGKVVDWFIDPVGFFLTTPEDIAQTVMDGITDRDDNDAVINQLYYESLEPYTATRAAYLQHQSYK